MLWLVFRSAASAHWVGRLGDRILNWVLHFFRKPESDRVERAVLHFRDQTNDMVHQRGWLLTAAVLASQLSSPRALADVALTEIPPAICAPGPDGHRPPECLHDSLKM